MITCNLSSNHDWTGTLANGADVASDQGLHCLLKILEVKG